jgi:hypothetical protein
MVTFLVSSRYWTVFSDGSAGPTGRVYSVDLDKKTSSVQWEDESLFWDSIDYTPSSNMLYGVDIELFIMKWDCHKNSKPQEVYGHSWGTHIIKVRTRTVSGKPRIYFLAFPSPFHLQTAKHAQEIYYLDDQGMPHDYYKIDNDLFLTPKCAGQERPALIGEFAFDDKNNLYLAHGRWVPSRIFKVTDAGEDRVESTSTIQPIYDNLYGGEIGLHYEPTGSAGSLYFCHNIFPVANSPYTIYQLDLSTTPGQPKDTGVQMVPSQAPPPLPPDSYEDFSDITAGLPKGMGFVRKRKESVVGGRPHEPKPPPVIFPEPTRTPTPTPPPPPPPDAVVEAQEWVQQILNARIGRFGYALRVTQFSYNLIEGTTSDRVTGYVRDQYGYWHTYDVRVTKDGKVEAHNSIVL